MKPLARWLALALGALALALAGCGDGDEGDTGASNGGSAYPDPGPVADDGCTSTYPNRAAQDAEGLVIACLTDDATGVRIENVSPQVLDIRPTAGVDRIVDDTLESDVGVSAAYEVTGFGWVSDRSYFVLPIGGTLVADGPGPATVTVSPDVGLTAEANTARYFAEWAADRLSTPGRRAVSVATDCAETASSYAERDEYLDDVIHSALDTGECAYSIKKLLAEAGQDAEAELPRARTAILEIARPVAEERLLYFTVRLAR